jgi:hypothetical protein
MKTTEEKKFWKKFAQAYKKVATLGVYDPDKAFKIDASNPLAIETPQHFLNFLEKYGCGCCLHYSWALIAELQKAGIDASWAVVPEATYDNPNAQKCVVVYRTPSGKEFVADVIEDVKAGVTMPAYARGTSCVFISSQAELKDNSCFELDYIAKRDGYLRIYPEPNPKETFMDYWNRTDYREI